MTPHSSQSTAAPDVGLEALAQACARNAPIEVVRRELAGQVPMARGRMLEMTDSSIRVERLRVIGRNTPFRAGHELDAFFDYNGTVFHFRSKVESVEELVQLNAALVVPGMVLVRPLNVATGQRRASFRVGLAARMDAPPISMWMLREGQELGPEGEPPSPKPDFTGRLADASTLGLGVIVEGVTYSRFRHDTPCLVHVMLPDAAAPLPFLCEVRQSRRVQDTSSRVGLSIVGPVNSDRREHQQHLRTLTEYITHIQRSQLRSGDSGDRKAS